jgi:hypothetical protein
MEAAYGKFGDAISGTGIINNYYDAVAQYREAQKQAFANMAKVLKDNADKQSMTSSPSVIAQPRNMGNIGKLKGDTPYGPTQPKNNLPSMVEAVKPIVPEISGPIRPTMEGSGGTQIQDVPMGNYYNDQLQGFAGTKKGMADFMNQLMDVEANQGTRMDMTGNFAMQDANDIRRTNPTGIPSMQNLLAMPEEINKQRINLQNEALSKEELFNSQRAEQTIAELIAKYPQAHAALQDGTLTIDANGAFKYNNEKSKGVSDDARNQIASFIGETGTLGKYYTAPIDKGGQGFKRQYGQVYAPNAMPRESSRKPPDIKEDTFGRVDPDGLFTPTIRVRHKEDNASMVQPEETIPYVQKGYGGTNPEKPWVLFKPDEDRSGNPIPNRFAEYHLKNGTYQKVKQNLLRNTVDQTLKNEQQRGTPTYHWQDDSRPIDLTNKWVSTQELEDALAWGATTPDNKYNAKITRGSMHNSANIDKKTDEIRMNKRAEIEGQTK